MFQTIRALSRSVPQGRRALSSPSPPRSPKLSALRRDWLTDPATYPLIGIIGFASLFASFVGVSCLLRNPDVQLDKNKRKSILRYW